MMLSLAPMRARARALLILAVITTAGTLCGSVLSDDATVRVDLGKMDHILDLVGELAIAQAQVVALESGILKQAEAAVKVVEAAYRFGERGFLDVLDARRVFRAARAELITARYELASAWVEIERLRAIPGGKEQ